MSMYELDLLFAAKNMLEAPLLGLRLSTEFKDHLKKKAQQGVFNAVEFISS